MLRGESAGQRYIKMAIIHARLGKNNKQAMARGPKNRRRIPTQKNEKQFPDVKWKQFSINDLQDITRVEFTRVIIDKLLTIKHFHSTGRTRFECKPVPVC
jgi:hypothetical protein